MYMYLKHKVFAEFHEKLVISQLISRCSRCRGNISLAALVQTTDLL